jgi:predicted glycogen debranching enzyme
MAQAEGTELRTVYAGYHWFGDWGRDTMISFEGLTLVTGRFREAGAILRTFSHYVKDGLLPNLFPEGERQALYNTVDATLWYFHAIARYLEYTSDRTLIAQLFPVLQSIIEHHVKGTRFNIHMDKDGLIAAAAEGLQLTWMDAKMGDWVVTPRRGKPVEIQALWYNALQLMAGWAAQVGQSAEPYEQLAARARKSFNERYWNADRGCLFDVIDGPKGDDDSIRPNQIFALSLKHPVLDDRHREPVLSVVHDRLLTLYGLRTLSSDHPDYKAHYRGDLFARDGAYHQGTVWPWLIGHFVDAYLRLHPDPQKSRDLLRAFPDHLDNAGIGSISEIFDAEEPHAPGGCIAQAWSVAEVLRAWVRTGHGSEKKQR